MESKIIYLLSLFLENNLSEKQLSNIQEFLLSGGIEIVASKFLAILIFFILFVDIVIGIFIVILKIPDLSLFLPFLIIPILVTYVFIKQEKRAAEIEKSAPDFLRQLSAMLKVGLSFESAMEDLSKYGEGPLYDETRRAIAEISVGRNFDDAWMAMAQRLKSRELERIFTIILDGRKSGSSISNVIFDVSNNLRDILALKRERKSSVMMAVMFLVISAVIASPFALGMVSVYSQFMQSFGKQTQLIMIAPFAGQIYLVIHSVLVGLIISIIMYGDVKKGIKFSIPLAFGAYLIFYLISNFAGAMFLN
ncbi:type II secretion system F family protein [uncultured Methanobrevibacter sp.]|uniref:type II secretion system F family protein n=1 Tax=uncultured Methanobrevibacter sp. TaxID=253161 RepID=UPI00262E3B3E|nr:type II secretion system F family protein [uncultured Methanobrevibacter sp.]